MENESSRKNPPESSEVFSTTDGKKIRIEYSKVFAYVGKTKSHSTTIDYGYDYSDNRQTYILDIDFDDFDAKLTGYKKELENYYKEYYESETVSSY